jgi:rubrerythrin
MINKWDMSMFELEDLYRMAVAVERVGYDLYSYLINHAANAAVKSEMEFLREEEARHEAFFQSRIKSTKAHSNLVNPQLMTLIEDEFRRPIRALFENRVMEGKVQALQFALEMEQKTITLYSSMKKDRNQSGVVADLEAIIEEEENHKRKLLVIMAY